MAAAIGGLPKRRGQANYPVFAPLVVTITTATSGVCPINTAEAETIIINGTTAITSFGVAPSGAVRRCRAAASFTITHNATSLFCLTSANIAAVANDTFTMVSLGVGNWYMHSYVRATGGSLVSGLLYWTESNSTASPNNAVNASVWTPNVATTDGDAVIQVKGVGSLLANLPDSAVAGGNKRGSQTIDLQLVRTAADQVAGATQSVLVGGQNSKIGSSGTYAGIFAGQGHDFSAAGANSVALGGNVNTELGTNSFFGGGNNNTHGAGSGCWTLGGNVNSIGGVNYSGHGGYSNTLNASFSAQFGQSIVTTAAADNSFGAGYNLLIDALYASAWGNGSTTRGVIGSSVHASSPSGQGAEQAMSLVLRGSTTNATPLVLTVDAAAAAATNQIVVPTGSVVVATVMVTCRNTTTGAANWWVLAGACTNITGTVALVGASTIVASSVAGVVGALAVILADNTNKNLSVRGTGLAATNLHWGARVLDLEIVGG